MDSTEIAQLDQHITDTEARLVSLYQERLQLLEGEIQRSQGMINGIGGGKASAPVAREAGKKRGPKPSVTAKPKSGKKPKGKRTRMSSEEVVTRIVGAIEAAGAMGISQIAISKDSGVTYPTVAKKLTDGIPGIRKEGTRRDARYFVK